MAAANIKFLRGKYIEDESFLCLGYPEPHIRHQESIFYSERSKWSVKVTFRSEAIQQQFSGYRSRATCIFVRKPIKNKLERRREFQSFMQCIDFEKLSLIPNTVTEVSLVLESAELNPSVCYPDKLILVDGMPADSQNRFLTIANRLKVTIQEDPQRIIYPTYAEDLIWPKVWEKDIWTEGDISGSALRIKRAGENISYAYKIVDRPFYNPNDTFVFLRELGNLKLLRGKSHIVQLCYIVVSNSPYQTTFAYDESLVIRGFLLEYHPYGTLEERLKKGDLDRFPWKCWPLQIGYGLLHLHQHGITHMDLKPSNIVIDTYGNALLIDVSGIGGITPEWMAPEMRDKSFLGASLEEREQNDVWAYGRMVLAIAQSRDWREDVGFLREVGRESTHDDPQKRIGLLDAISKIRKFETIMGLMELSSSKVEGG